MSGVIDFGGLAAAYLCEECGRAKSFRLWPGVLTGCMTCDEVITRHRCTGIPPVADRTPGQTWECPECRSVWELKTETKPCPDCCVACGHTVAVRHWVLAEKGDRVDNATRYVPQPYTPFRTALPRPLGSLSPERPYDCYRMPNGSEVHVKPGCRCKR